MKWITILIGILLVCSCEDQITEEFKMVEDRKDPLIDKWLGWIDWETEITTSDSYEFYSDGTGWEIDGSQQYRTKVEINWETNDDVIRIWKPWRPEKIRVCNYEIEVDTLRMIDIEDLNVRTFLRASSLSH